MFSNLEKYKKDSQELIKKGENLLSILRSDDDLKKFRKDYEVWYSESLALIKIVLPERVDDFRKYYDQKGHKSLKEYIIYTPPRRDFRDLSPFLDDSYVPAKMVDHAKVLFENQLGIVKAAQKRFESSLFDIKQLVQADLFDSELEAARELNKKSFTRATGAVAGVVLERHLSQLCDNHSVKVTKKNPAINDYNQLLKNNDVIEMKDWRFIQHLADLRNLSDHIKEREPKKEEIEELIDGVEKITKTIFW